MTASLHPLPDAAGAHARLAILFSRWIGICLNAGEYEQSETCRADASLHARLAVTERKVA